MGLHEAYCFFILLSAKQTNKQTNPQTYKLLFCFWVSIPISVLPLLADGEERVTMNSESGAN